MDSEHPKDSFGFCPTVLSQLGAKWHGGLNPPPMCVLGWGNSLCGRGLSRARDSIGRSVKCRTMFHHSTSNKRCAVYAVLTGSSYHKPDSYAGKFLLSPNILCAFCFFKDTFISINFNLVAFSVYFQPFTLPGRRSVCVRRRSPADQHPCIARSLGRPIIGETRPDPITLSLVVDPRSDLR